MIGVGLITNVHAQVNVLCRAEMIVKTPDKSQSFLFQNMEAMVERFKNKMLILVELFQSSYTHQRDWQLVSKKSQAVERRCARK